MRTRFELVVLACLTACQLDVGGIGGTDATSTTASTSDGPTPASTSSGATTHAASTTAVLDGTTTSVAPSTSRGADTTESDVTETSVASSTGEVLELCDGIDNDADGATDEPSTANLACDDCTSIVLDGTAFATCTDALRWEDARARCQLWGGDLASFDDLEQQQVVVASGAGDRWIGLTDAEDEDTWTWVAGEALTYEDWRANEPDDGGPGEDCGQIRGVDEGWGDAVCGSERDYVCEVTVE